MLDRKDRFIHILTRNTGKDVALERTEAFKSEEREKKNGYEDEVEEDGDSIKTLNDLPPFPKTMEKSPLAPQLIKRK